MKKYISRATKWLAIPTIVSVAVLIAGIIGIVANSSNVGLQIGLTMLGGFLSILFLTCFFAEKRRYVTIDCEKILLPRGAIKNGKISFQKTVINFDEIRAIESELYKSDGIHTKDTLFHTLTLKDDIMIKFTLYAYGDDVEKEILESIKKHI